MTCVIDASAAIEIVLNRPHSVKFRKIISDAKKVITTDLYKAETTNVIWKYVSAGHLEREAGLALLPLLQNLVDEFCDIDENKAEALSEAVKHKHSVYDMLYLTLARRTPAVLLTVDKQLARLAKSVGVEVASS